MSTVIYIICLTILINSLPFLTKNLTADEKDKVWYRVEISQSANPIYVDYRSIDKKKDIARYEQLEFLSSKQKLEGSETEYQFVISKMDADCVNKRYFIKEEKYFDSEVNIETDKISEKMVHNVKHEDKSTKHWKAIEPDTPLEKVFKFVCLYKDTDN